MILESEDKPDIFCFLLNQLKLFIADTIGALGYLTILSKLFEELGNGKIRVSETQKSCVSPDEESDALRRASFFDGGVLTSSNSLVAEPEHNSASRSNDKSALQEDTYCLEQDCFGDEEDAADMIGRVSRREAELVSLQIFVFLLTRETNKSMKVIVFKPKLCIFLLVSCFIFFLLLDRSMMPGIAK